MKKLIFPPKTWIKTEIDNKICIGITGDNEDESFIIINEDMYLAEVTWKMLSNFEIKKLNFKKQNSQINGKYFLHDFSDDYLKEYFKNYNLSKLPS